MMISLPGPFTTLLGKGRAIKSRASGRSTAAEAVGEITHGMMVAGVTKGGFSMLDLIEHVLATTGPAEVEVSTWTMGVYDADVLWRFTQNESVERIRFLVDPSMFGRKAELAEAFILAFGVDAIRAFDNHAKFTLISNADWRVAISSSMNLNRNRRLENFVLIEGEEPWTFYRSIVDAAFDQLPAYRPGQKRTTDGGLDGFAMPGELELW